MASRDNNLDSADHCANYRILFFAQPFYAKRIFSMFSSRGKIALYLRADRRLQIRKEPDAVLPDNKPSPSVN
jgi:hypothetical protein